MIHFEKGQASWSQHDFGHSSFLGKPKYNRYLQSIFLGLIKGASSEWWNHMHNQHHAKPNIIRKDPDIRFGALFMLGKTIPREVSLNSFFRNFYFCY